MNINNKYFFGIPLLLIVLLSSCSEKDSWFPNLETTGIVVDYTTGKPVADATVTLIRVATGGIGWLSGEETEPVMDVKTASDGSYKIKFRDKKKYTYRLIATKDNYYPSDDVIFGNSSQVIYALNKTQTIYLYSEATLKIHAKNVSPFDGYDKIYVEINYKLGDMWVSGQGNNKTYWGQYVDSIFPYGVTGNVAAKVEWTVTKNKIRIPFDTMLYCPAFDTTTFNINY